MAASSVGSGSGQDFSVSGVVVMKGHPRHPALRHHGLADLSATADRVELRELGGGPVLAAAPPERVTVGTSTTLRELGSVVFLDFTDGTVPPHERQWAVDFGPVADIGRFLGPDGSVHHEKLVEYRRLLSVEDIEAGIGWRRRFVDAVTAGGGRYEDESTSFEELIAKWPW